VSTDTTERIPLPNAPARSEQTYTATSNRPSRLRGFLRGLRTTVVVLLLIAAAVAGGTYIARDRLAARAYVELSNAVLTAQPVPVGTAAAGTVSTVDVAPQNQVSAGDQLAEVTVIAPDGDPEDRVLKAPIDGIISEVNVTTGGVATPGQPVVTMYDPARLTFQASVSVEDLRRLRLGDPIVARLERVVARVGDDPSSGGFTVVLVPDGSEVNTVRTLVPGLPFTATVDTKTAVGGTPAVNSAK
jgi:hypothetical protein